MVPQGMGFECSAIRQFMEGQPIGQSASLGKRLGGSPLRIETAASLRYGCLTRAASGARSKRDGTSRCGDRHVRHPPFCAQSRNWRTNVMEYTPGKDKYLDALVLLQNAMNCFAHTVCAGRSVRNLRGLIRR